MDEPAINDGLSTPSYTPSLPSEPMREPTDEVAAPLDNASYGSNLPASSYARETGGAAGGRGGPYSRNSFNVYAEDASQADPVTFIIDEAEARFSLDTQNFFIKKKRPGDEIDVKKLGAKAHKLFLDKGGSREKEIKAILNSGDKDSGPAIRIHRGQTARELKQKYADRIIPSRWHEKWKDMGDDFDNGLKDPEVPKHLGAKSRWILQGFHDPDIHLLNRTVPTPSTSDVPLGLQTVSYTHLTLPTTPYV